MATLTSNDKERLLEEARREFPGDEMMQNIHYVRLLHYYQIEGLSSEERIQFFGNVDVVKA